MVGWSWWDGSGAGWSKKDDIWLCCTAVVGRPHIRHHYYPSCFQQHLETTDCCSRLRFQPLFLPPTAADHRRYALPQPVVSSSVSFSSLGNQPTTSSTRRRPAASISLIMVSAESPPQRRSSYSSSRHSAVISFLGGTAVSALVLAVALLSPPSVEGVGVVVVPRRRGVVYMGYPPYEAMTVVSPYSVYPVSTVGPYYYSGRRMLQMMEIADRAAAAAAAAALEEEQAGLALLAAGAAVAPAPAPEPAAADPGAAKSCMTVYQARAQ